MTQVDIVRHAELFDPQQFNEPIHVIGAGASGSWLVLQLAKLGLTDITVWDFDHVESHNIANQLYGMDDVGELKVDALAKYIESTTRTKITTRGEAYNGQHLAGIVFCMIDTMAGRKEIWSNSIKFKSSVSLYVEPRMGLNMGRIYNMKPMDIPSHGPYEATLYGDDVAEVSACGASVSVVTSAITLAAWCVRQLINYNDETPLAHEILIDLQYNNIITTNWGA